MSEQDEGMYERMFWRTQRMFMEALDREAVLLQERHDYSYAALRVRCLESVLHWALGELDPFPPLPPDWPADPYYWRGELRRRFMCAISEQPTDGRTVGQG